MKTDIPFKSKPYRVPINCQKKIATEIERVMDLGGIELSNSPYVKPIVPVVKKNEVMCLCVDKIIIPYYQSNKNINELLGARERSLSSSRQ